ncbi:MAG: MBL fold metallo-hydrolase [Archangium sp.]
MPSVFNEKSFELEGQKVELITIDNGESDAATAFWIPSTQTLIAGDAVYDGVHSWLADAPTQARRDTWLKNLATLKALKPTVVIGGHRSPEAKSTGAAIDDEVTYVKDFSTAVARAKTPEELTAAVTAKHGNLALPVILDIAAKASVKK